MLAAADRASHERLWHSASVTSGVSGSSAYDRGFYESQAGESKSSAQVVVPLVLDLLPTESVLDVGGGVGTWGAAFLSNGVDDVTCVDGDYVDRKQLLVPTERFHAHDLERPLDLERQFGLVTCLEVAEHLPAGAAPVLVSSLARHSDLIMFSAGIPFQGGTNHVNEQWPSYWVRQFADRGFEVFDILRPRLWPDRRVAFWYRQNLLVFARGVVAEQVRALPLVSPPIDIVHPEPWAISREGYAEVRSIRGSLHDLKAAAWRRLRR